MTTFNPNAGKTNPKDNDANREGKQNKPGQSEGVTGQGDSQRGGDANRNRQMGNTGQPGDTGQKRTEHGPSDMGAQRGQQAGQGGRMHEGNDPTANRDENEINDSTTRMNDGGKNPSHGASRDQSGQNAGQDKNKQGNQGRI